MAFTEIQIVSMALGLLGKGAITSWGDAGEFGSTAKTYFDLLKESTIASHNWRFATKVQQLSQDTGSPLIDSYMYIYSLPGDCVAIWRLHPDQYDFQIYDNKKLYSNANSLIIEYRYVPDATLWPHYFVDYFICELALKLALANAESEGMAQKIEVLLGKQLSQALFNDSQSHPNAVVAFDEILDYR